MLRREDVPQLLDRLLRPTFVWRMARGMNWPGAGPYRTGAETRQANAERDIAAVVNELVSRDAELWDRIEVHWRHAEYFRLEAEKPRGQLSRRVDLEEARIYQAKVDALLEAIAIIRGGVYATAKMAVDREWADRRDGTTNHRVRDESKLTGVKHGD
jgi:hypothetical protein